MTSDDNDNNNNIDHVLFKAPSSHQRRNAISIPPRKSSLGYNITSIDGKTSIIPPSPSPSPTSEAQMSRMKQLMCKAIHQLRTLAGEVAQAEENAVYWQKKWNELNVQHSQLRASHHDALVALKTTRRLLLSNRREKLELRRCR